MQLTDEDIIKFQDIYLKRFDKLLSKKEAHEEGMKLLSLMAAVYKPIKLKDLSHKNY